MKKIEVLTTREVLGQVFNLYGDLDNPLFLAKDVANLIEHNQVARMIDLVDGDEKLKCLISTSGQSRELWFLTEDGLYEILLQSRKPIAKAFKKEVKALLKQLRKTGVIINEHATESAIKFEEKFGKYRIRKTFINSNNIFQDYKQFLELSKAEWKSKRLDNVSRIKLSNLIAKGLNEKLNNNKNELRPSEMLAIQELIADVKTDIIKLENKKHGGLKSGQTKKIKQLEEKLDEACPAIEKFNCVNYHAFSVNCMYKTVMDTYNKQPLCVKTEAFKNWLYNFPTAELDGFEHIDFNKTVNLHIRFVCLSKFDVDNLVKAFQDKLAVYYAGGQDKNIQIREITVLEHCNNYADGKIYFYLTQAKEASNSELPA